MAFRPGYHQKYYLIAKHSGMALSIESNRPGTPLQQQKFLSGDEKLKFRLDKGQSYNWILPQHHNMYLAVNNSSHDNYAPVIEWQWEPNAPNSMFEFIHVGDGYYLIMARHSGKFFDVLQGSTMAGGSVIQHPLRRGDNQLFKIVPVPENGLKGDPRSLVQTNEMVRTAVLSLISGGIPKAGAGIAFIVGTFWKKNDGMADFWEQMKSYVDNRIITLIRADKIESLRKMLDGKLDSLAEIDGSAIDGKKTMGDRIYSAIDDIVRNQNLYVPVNDDNANDIGDGYENILYNTEIVPAGSNDNAADTDIRDILPYFIGIGTILITLRHTIATDRDTWFVTPISNEQKDINARILTRTIAQYKKYLLKGRQRLLEWRLSKIKDAFTERDRSYVTSDYTLTSFAKDDYGLPDEPKWEVKWEYSGSGGSSAHSGDPNHYERAKHAVTERRNYIKQQFEAEIDEMLQIAKYWGDFDPTAAKYQPQVVRREVGAFGGWPTYRGFPGVTDKTIAKIVMHSNFGNSVCGIEVFYKEKSEHEKESDGISSGLIGVTGQTSSTLKPGVGEYINGSYGFGRENLTGLWFTTNLGNIVGVGERIGANHFIADLPDSFHASLVRIAGNYSQKNIENLKFEWEYKY